MKILIMLSFFQLNLISQETIYFHTSGTNSKFSKFEKEFIENSIKLLNKRYNKNKVEIKFVPLPSFSKVFDLVNCSDEKKHIHHFGMNSISVTEERKEKFDFSDTYMHNKHCFLTGKSNKYNQNSKVGYLVGSVIEPYINELKQKYTYEFIPYKISISRLNDLKNNKIQLIISDYVDIWSYDLNLIEEIDLIEKDQFAMLFPKKCILSSKIKETLKYYIGSIPFYKLVKKHFGDEALNYSKRNFQ
jgi:hypothetical protein